jgi:AraC-like DNA-binding protein
MDTYHEYLPSLELRDYIDCMWSSEVSETPAEGSYHILPDNRVDIIFRKVNSKVVTSFVGPMSRSFTTPSTNVCGVRMRPEFARALLGFPMSELTDQTVDVNELGLFSPSEREALADSCSLKSCLYDVDQSLLRMALQVKSKVDPRVKMLIDKVEESSSVEIDQIGLSKQHLRRIFKQNIGFSFKRFHRIHRLKLAQSYYLENPSSPLVELALKAGFFDQSHMINDCKKLTGMKPKDLFL